MLERYDKQKDKNLDHFYFCSSILPGLHADYISFRLMYHVGGYTLAYPILQKAFEIAEKSFKFYIANEEKLTDVYTDLAEKYLHNVDQLRERSALHAKIFDDQDIKDFTKSLSDKSGKFYQYIRYGNQSETEGMGANFKETIFVVDKIFFTCMLSLQKDQSRLFNFMSLLKILVTRHRFDQSRDADLLIEALKEDNKYFEEYKIYCELLDKEHKELEA